MCVSVAWFTFDPCLSSPELCFTPDNMTVTCEGFEHRLALGSVGFSRGVHYWEFTIDRFDADTDPSFGVARLDVAKEEMLGKCADVRSAVAPCSDVQLSSARSTRTVRLLPSTLYSFSQY